MDKRRSEAVEKSEQAVPAPWLAGTEGVKKTGQCTSLLEILLVEDDAGDMIPINEIIGEERRMRRRPLTKQAALVSS